MRPLKVGIIGGGPSGFYVASRILHHLPSTDFRIHIYDRLWAPHGLVRYGVAPDHPEVKNCIHKFNQVSADPRVRFFGNVAVSENPPLSNIAIPLPLQTMFPYYTHIVFATGAALPRLHPLLPLSQFCVPALDLVHWYTMHPLSKYKPPKSPIPEGTRHITLIGHGNVSLDIARLLLTPLKVLSSLDLPEHVLFSMERLWQSLQHINIVGRRGPNDVRFTAKELREIMTLECARLVPIPQEIMAPAESGVGGDDDAGKLSRQQKRLLAILKKGSNLTHGDKTFSIDFWRSPIGYEIRPSPADKRVLLKLEKTKKDQAGGLIGTGSTENIETDLIVTSLGYESDAEMLGADFPWFDKSSGHIRTQPAGGRLISPEGHLIPNIYASGWASRGARGVLTGTMLDAHDVAGAIIQDWLDANDNSRTTSKNVATADIESPSTIVGSFADLTLVAPEWPAGGLDKLPPTVETGLQQGRVITYETWRRIDQAEQERGKGEKERERMSWQEVRDFLGLS